MTSAEYALYSYWRSSCSYRVRIALEWKGITYDYKGVNLPHGQHQDVPYSALNPNHRVPALVLADGRVVTQSGAILEFLEEAHPNKPKLLPSDPLLRADVRNLCGLIGCDIQPIQNVSVLNKVAENDLQELKDAKKLQWAQFWTMRGFRALEKELERTAGIYSVGDAVTLADLYLVPQVHNACLANVDMAEFPTINKVVSKLETLPAFQRARPEAQPDAT